MRQALAALRAAVAQAEPEGYVRPFVDEGGPLAALLAVWHASERDGRDPTGGPSPAYLDALLAAFERQASALPGARTAVLVEQLSARELVLEQSTVKTHLIHLYGKLGAHSRTQALARARELHLLD